VIAVVLTHENRVNPLMFMSGAIKKFEVSFLKSNSYAKTDFLFRFKFLAMTYKTVIYKIIAMLIILRLLGAGYIMLQSYGAADNSFASWKQFQLEKMQKDSLPYQQLIQSKYFSQLEQAPNRQSFDSTMELFEHYRMQSGSSSAFAK
jgi:hypothetical protein